MPNYYYYYIHVSKIQTMLLGDTCCCPNPIKSSDEQHFNTILDHQLSKIPSIWPRLFSLFTWPHGSFMSGSKRRGLWVVFWYFYWKSITLEVQKAMGCCKGGQRQKFECENWLLPWNIGDLFHFTKTGRLVIGLNATVDFPLAFYSSRRRLHSRLLPDVAHLLKSP